MSKYRTPGIGGPNAPKWDVTAEQLNAWSAKKTEERRAGGINTNVGANRAKGSKHGFLPCDEGGHWPAAPFIKRCACGTTYCGRHPHDCEAAS